MDQEHAEYLLHENNFNDQGYRQFLSRLSAPLLTMQLPGHDGLDFGCGPTPVLAAILESEGMNMTYFDPLFFPDRTVLTKQYDFITCTEAIEHFHTPDKELKLLTSLLKPEGLLAIMTKRVINQQRFTSWHYKNDPTHVCFFSEATFHYIARTLGFRVSFPTADVVFMQKEP
ncbi:class I SAM-dependent methyltransferase [Alteromonas sp. H39]|uniref:class I SAM-dependent methyltransferase n=1 Tax=Alteromonas sp. H39 TaxID=3389876 RepID=UPI0039E1E19D